jgi:hypothetical protein
VNKIITIPLASRIQPGHLAIVDEDDADIVADRHWILMVKGHRQYAYTYRQPRQNNCNKKLLLHRLILNAPDGIMVDHINGDGLDNRRENLRLATLTQNFHNSTKHRDGTQSRYKGVESRPRGRWRARICVNGIRISAGEFATELEAAQAYDRAARLHHGEYARTNFD